MFYVAWLLYHPPDHPIHAIDLAAKVPEIYRQQLGLPTLVDPFTGKTVQLQSDARLQERSLALDDREAIRRLFKKQQELEAILDSDASEPEKAEALRDLEQIYQFQKHHARRTTDTATRTVRSVRRAITRLQHHLQATTDVTGQPNPALRAFANHIQRQILIPSARHTAHPGCFTYEPPPDIHWPP